MSFEPNRVFAGVGESIFSTVTRWSAEAGALDLGQGYPGFSPPDGLMDRLAECSNWEAKSHQYAPSNGVPELRRELADFYGLEYGADYDPDREITVTTGATEALSAGLYGLLNPGDRVIVFEPVYDLYIPVARRAGARVDSLSLGDDFELPTEELRGAVRPETKLVVLNNPHNPTGKIFSEESLDELVTLARERDFYLLSDAVYHHLTFGDSTYRPLVDWEGARERTLWLGSAGKLFNATGWKTGWALGPPPLTDALRGSHQFTTFAGPRPLQRAIAEFMGDTDLEEYLHEYRRDYRRRLEVLLEGLESSPFDVRVPDGTYYMTVFLPRDRLGEDSPLEYVRRVIRERGVAFLPLDSFRTRQPGGERVGFRLGFCKPVEELEEAVKRLRSLPGR